MSPTFRRLLILIAAVTLGGDALAQEAAPRVVRVAAFNYYPGIFRAEDGTIKGFYVDMLAEIAAREHWAVQYQFGTWTEGLERIKRNEVDVLTSVAYTPERGEYMDFTREPLLTVWGQVYVHESSKVDGILSMQGKHVAVMKDDFNAQAFRDLAKAFNLNCRFMEVGDFAEVFKAVESRRVDAGVVNSTFGAARHTNFKVKETDVVFNPFNIHLTVAKGRNQEVLNTLDSYLATWRSDPASPYHRARQNWIRGTTNTVAIVPGWLTSTLYALAAVLILATSFVVLLRQQVRRATREVHRRDARLRAIFEASRGVGFVITETRDRVPKIIEFSPGAEKILGYVREEILGRASQMLFAATSPATPSDQPGLTPADFSGEVALRRSDGRTFAAHLTINPIAQEVTGHEHGSIWIIMDITERKRAEESLTRLATAVEQAGETIVITDARGTILYVNPAFEKTSGYSRAEAVGQNPRVLKSGKHDAEFYRRMWQTLGRGEVWQDRLINRRKDGTLYEEDATISPVRDPAGTTVNYVAVKRDVTRELQLEAQFRQAQKMEAIGHLAGGVAHDFNNILAALMMGLELLRGQENLDRDTKALLQDLDRETKRAAVLTRQLLMFSRRSVLEVRVLDLNEVVANLLKMLGRLLGEHLTLVFERHSPLPLVEADAGMLEQVLMNLVVNARDAMPRGGRIILAIEGAEFNEQQVAANSARRTGRFVCLTVADTGCGMDAATLKRLFEPFFTTKELGKGTGLGLATVYGIVAQHGGWVEVESKVDQGTTFRVYLPVSTKAALKADTEENTPPAVPRGQETLLVVEDDSRVRHMLVHALKLLGYQVIAAANGQEAMNLWQIHGRQIDLLLTDMVMPEGMTGLELAKRVRAEKPTLKIIISSGYSTELVELGNATAKGIVYLAKPYEVSRLGTVLRRCLHPLQTPS